jgi:hypothetical protein
MVMDSAALLKRKMQADKRCARFLFKTIDTCVVLCRLQLANIDKLWAAY